MIHRNNGHLPATQWMLTTRPIPGIPLDALWMVNRRQGTSLS
jgi:hypothetical protein